MNLFDCLQGAAPVAVVISGGNTEGSGLRAISALQLTPESALVKRGGRCAVARLESVAEGPVMLANQLDVAVVEQISNFDGFRATPQLNALVTSAQPDLRRSNLHVAAYSFSPIQRAADKRLRNRQLQSVEKTNDGR